MDLNTTPTADDVHIVEADDDSSFGEFVCCVCLDLLYKPVVLACGHISCFWCVFQTMNPLQESQCPICRHSYNHFPGICQLLHFLILKLYPLDHKRRETQVAEEEKEYGDASPQLSDKLIICHYMEKLDSSNFSSHSNPGVFSESHSPKEDPQKDKSEIQLQNHCGDTSLPSASPETSEGCGDNVLLDTGLVKNHHGNGTCSVVCTDVACTACKNMLFRPVVLNCGHVYCESCLISLEHEILTCQVCQSVHPYGLPRICLILEHFLEEQFPKVYAQRRDALLQETANQNGNHPNYSTTTYPSAAQSSSIPKSHYLSWWTGNGPKVHVAVGCDYCGMSPIIGERYKCKDCVEKIGFDLCEKCYKTPSKLPGRFNQQHRPDHKFEIVQPNIFFRQEGEESEDDVDGSDAQEDTPPPTIL